MAADKRGLYHLAPTQTPSPQYRKPLAQGRLDTSPQHGLSFHSEKQESTTKGYSPADHKPRHVTPVKPDEPKHGHSLPRTSTQQEGPRLKPPAQYTEPGQEDPLLSPQAVEPSSSLSLSENDDSNTSSLREPESKQWHPESTNQMTRNGAPTSQTEVPVVASMTTSPVRVVCHSPRRSKAIDKDQESEVVRGYTDKASRVEVPSVTRVAVKHSENEMKPSHDGSLSEDSLENIQTIAGSPVDPNSSAVRVALDDNDKENAALIHHPYDPAQYKSFMGDEGGHPGGPLSAALDQSNVRQQLFDFSVASVDSSMAKEPSASSDTSVKKKKKHAGRIIPSRYMESKKSVSQPKKNSSFQTKRKVSFQSSLREHSSQHDSTQLNVSAPYHNTSLKGSKIVTSTPAVGSVGVLPGHPVGDMAAPTPILPPSRKTGRGMSPNIKGTASKVATEASGKAEEKTKKALKIKAPLLPQRHMDHITKPKAQELTDCENIGPYHILSEPDFFRFKERKNKGKFQSLPTKVVTVTYESGRRLREIFNTVFDWDVKWDFVKVGELSQRQLELEYARLLQWIFLESKLKSTFHQQEKDAQAQLYSMWQENEKLRRELADRQLELDNKNKTTELDEQLTLQLSGLKPIGGNLTKQILHYDQLSSALNATCQYMPVDDVIIDNQEELLIALSESERLLGELDGLTRHRTHKVSNFSKEVDILSKVTDSEVQEQGRCQELLAAASTLGTQERSLQAHAIQQSIPSYCSSDDRSL